MFWGMFQQEKKKKWKKLVSEWNTSELLIVCVLIFVLDF